MLSLKRSGKSHPKVVCLCGIGLVAVGAIILEFGSSESRWQKRTSFVGPAHPILVVAFSPDGERLASGDSEGDLFIWQWGHDKPFSVRHSETKSRLLSLAFSSDGRLLASGYSDGSARIWDVSRTEEAGQILQVLDANDSGLFGVCFSPDGSTLATASVTGTLRLWDARLGTEKAGWQTHQERISCLAFNPDGKTLATGSLDHSVTIWDVTSTKELISLTNNTAGIYALAYSGNGRSLVTAGADGLVKIWDTADWRVAETLKATHPLLLSVGISADGQRIIAGSLEGIVNLWDLNSVKEPLVLKHLREPWYKAVALAPNGTRLTFGMNSDFSVEGWELTAP